MDLPNWSVDEALARARLALGFIEAGKRSMGQEYGYLNPVLHLAEAFAVLDERLSIGLPPPREWTTRANVDRSDLRLILRRVSLQNISNQEIAALDRLRKAAR
jgi:hypothetical protein